MSEVPGVLTFLFCSIPSLSLDISPVSSIVIMSDEKINPPSYMPPAQPQSAAHNNASGMQFDSAQRYPSQQSYTPQQSYPQQQSYSPYTPPQGVPQGYAAPGPGPAPSATPAHPGYSSYPPAQTPVIMMAAPGQQYQQQRKSSIRCDRCVVVEEFTSISYHHTRHLAMQYLLYVPQATMM